MTTGPSYERVFDRLKTALKSWDTLLSTDVSDLQAIIVDAGLSGQKAPRLKAIAARLSDDFGSVSLAPLADLPDDDVLSYLTGLPGVGTKTAKCVMLFTMNRSVLPVDTHVARIGTRLGLVPTPTSGAASHQLLERAVAPRDRYRFHVNALEHGRRVCRVNIPSCGHCALNQTCPSKLVFA